MTTITSDTPLECVPVDKLGDAQQNPYARVIAKMAKQHRLLSVQWELTYRCNEQCTHCYLDVFKPNERVAGELSTEQIKRALDEIAAAGALNLTFSGGEIFVRRDFFEIAEYARRKRFAVRLMSNGLLITPEVADRIAALKPTGMEISLYAADPETHDRITQRRRLWELTTRAIRLLRERGIHVLIKTPLMRETVRQLPAMRELAQSLDAAFRYDVMITAKDNGGQNPLRHRLTHDDLVWLYRQETPFGDEPLKPIGADDRSCSIGLHSLVIDPYGNVFPCLQTRIAAGNILVEPLKEIWQSVIFRETSQLTFGALPVCRACELNAICHRCHANALVETGSLYMPAAANCREALARRKVMIEKGILPSDYPIPVHLRDEFAPMSVSDVGIAANERSSFIPLDALTFNRRAAEVVI